MTKYQKTKERRDARKARRLRDDFQALAIRTKSEDIVKRTMSRFTPQNSAPSMHTFMSTYGQTLHNAYTAEKEEIKTRLNLRAKAMGNRKLIQHPEAQAKKSQVHREIRFVGAYIPFNMPETADIILNRVFS